jgi:UDP-glucose 4-epimerase
MKNIAITGISGYIGSRLLLHLADLDEVEKIVGIDINPPKYSSPKLRFYRQNITTPLSDILTENGVDAAVHLAFVLKPTRDRVGAEHTDVDGSSNFLEACRQAKVEHIVYLSSHTVYGAYPDNPLYLEETSPLRPLPDFQYSRDKVQTEQLLQDFGHSQSDVHVTILRSCPVIGPNAAGSVVAPMFKPPVMIAVAGYDPPMQFVHEDDLVGLVVFALAQKRAGIFNVAGDGEIKYSRVARTAGKRMLFIPRRALELTLRFSWALHLQSESPPSGLEFIKYPPVVSTEKLREETGFRFRYSSQEALDSFISAL